jgi:probable rRNA maturation factor
MISIEAYNDTAEKRLPVTKVKRAVEHVLKGERVRKASISIVFVSDEKIHEMNKHFLRHDYPTDVITFPLEEDVVDGEIYVSVDTARRQADEYKVSFTNELMRLAAHGTLHLVGYDDSTDEQRKKMSILEDRYIADL